MKISSTGELLRGSEIESEPTEAEAIKSAIFRFLSNTNDYQSVKMKEIREHLETSLSYAKGTFKQPKYKNYVEVFATQFLEIEKQKKQAAKQRQQQTAVPIASPAGRNSSSSSSFVPPPQQEQQNNNNDTSDHDAPTSDQEEMASFDSKKGKFSITESKIILKELQAYSTEHGIPLKELAPYYREDKRSFPELYERLMVLLPNRSKRVRLQAFPSFSDIS